jgi:hypothetical protein
MILGQRPPTTVPPATWEETFARRLLLTPKVFGGVNGNWVQPILFRIEGASVFGGPKARQWTGTKTPAAVNLAWDNAETLNAVWNSYPWPGEFWMFAKALMEFHGDAVQAIVYADRRLTKDEGKFWTSATMGADYPRIADRVNAILQKEIRQDKRRAITQAFGLAAVGLLLGGVLTGGALSLANKGIDQLKAHQKKELARGFKAMGDALRDGAPAFAAEMDRMAGIFGPEVFLEPPGATIPVAPASPPPGVAAGSGVGEKESAPNGLLVLWGRFVQWIETVLT